MPNYEFIEVDNIMDANKIRTDQYSFDGLRSNDKLLFHKKVRFAEEKEESKKSDIIVDTALMCKVCGELITRTVSDFSKRHYGIPLCRKHQIEKSQEED